MIDATAVYVLWLKEMKRFLRAKSRVIGSLAMPLFFLAFLGLGFNKMIVPEMLKDINYIRFLIPGIVGMGILFTSTFAGLSVLWDKEFGFLKEIMVAPVSRVSIVIGRIAGGATTALIQGLLILFISFIAGFKIKGILSFPLTILFMILISTTFIGLGLILASKMKDIHGFGIIMNFIIFPLFFLSGALYPIENLPKIIRYLSYIDPLTYGVDGLRASLIGISSFPFIMDLIIMIGFSIITVVLGAYFFEKSESA
ncbi:ABC transporter permease [Candidatus Aminicenantes bacterium AH-873-B07]|nr:ABC transporter permease [Candidatus Aminicenantes bacterium AH-873-B07]